MSKYRCVKMRVTPETNHLVQQELFKDGASWGEGRGMLPSYEKATHLFVNSSGKLTYLDDNDERYFMNHPFREVKVKFYEEVVITKAVRLTDPRPTVEVLGAVYYEEDVQAALKNLQQAD